jgi:hypothetical protein
LAEKSLITIVKDYIEIQRLFFLFFEKKKKTLQKAILEENTRKPKVNKG